MSDQSFRFKPGLAPQRTLPDHQYPEPFVQQTVDGIFVPTAVRLDFREPLFAIGLWPPEKVTSVPMPKAPMHENHSPVLWEHQVRSTWEISVVQAVPESLGMKSASNDLFRLCVLAPNAGHHPAAGRRVNDIRH